MIFNIENARKLNEGETYKNKFLIINEKYFSEHHKTAKNQLCFAVGGFGCDPKKIGVKIFANIYDENIIVLRTDILGIATEETIKTWEKEYNLSRNCLLPKENQELIKVIEAYKEEGYDETDIIDMCFEKGYTLEDFEIIGSGVWAKQVAEEHGLLP